MPIKYLNQPMLENELTFLIVCIVLITVWFLVIKKFWIYETKLLWDWIKQKKQ